MATIRKLRGRWQAQVRRRGVAPRAKSFDTKADAQRWAQDLEAEANRPDRDRRPMALIGGSAGVPGVNERPLRAHS